MKENLIGYVCKKCGADMALPASMDAPEKCLACGSKRVVPHE